MSKTLGKCGINGVAGSCCLWDYHQSKSPYCMTHIDPPPTFITNGVCFVLWYFISSILLITAAMCSMSEITQLYVRFGLNLMHLKFNLINWLGKLPIEGINLVLETLRKRGWSYWSYAFDCANVSMFSPAFIQATFIYPVDNIHLEPNIYFAVVSVVFYWYTLDWTKGLSIDEFFSR